MGSSTFSDRLHAFSLDLFVGRDAELERLLACLCRESPGPQVVTIEGAAGVGKSTLAKALVARASARGHPVAWVSFDPGLGSVSELAAVLTAVEWIQPAGGADRGRRGLLVLDGVEQATELLPWVFREGLKAIAEHVQIVLTSRARLPAALRAKLMATGRLTEVALDNLDHRSAARLAVDLGLPAARLEWAQEVCHGHPLAIILLAGSGIDHVEEAEPTLPGSTILELAAYFTDSLDPTQRAVLRVAATAANYDEDLFAAACPELDPSDRAAAHDWFRRQAFVTLDPDRLRLHDTVREAIFADLVSQAPAVYETYSRRISVELGRRMVSLQGRSIARAGTEITFARRGVPGIGELVSGDMAAVSGAWVEPAGAARAAARALVERHEGAVEADRFDAWTAAQPEALFVVRNSADEVIGVIFHPVLRGDATMVDDPVVDRFLEALDQYDRTVGSVGLFRWFFAASSYQDFSPELTAVMLSGPQVHVMLGERYRPVSGFVTHEPERWTPLAPRMMVERLEAPEFEHAGRRYGLWLLDLRQERSRPGSAMSDAIARHRRVLLESVMIDPDAPDGERTTGLSVRPSAEGAGAELSQPSGTLEAPFAMADVRSALRALGRPAQLDTSPLSVLVRSNRDEARQGQAIASLLREAIATLEADPHCAEQGELLRRAYLEPAPKHLALAADLGLAYGTFRHRLRSSIERLTELLLTGC